MCGVFCTDWRPTAQEQTHPELHDNPWPSLRALFDAKVAKNVGYQGFPSINNSGGCIFRLLSWANWGVVLPRWPIAT